MFGLRQTNESSANRRSDAPLVEMNPVEHTQIETKSSSYKALPLYIEERKKTKGKEKPQTH